PLTNANGQVVSAREYVRSLTQRLGLVDEATLDELTIQWRARVNQALRGHGAAVLGDGIITTASDETPARRSTGLDDHARRRAIEDIVYTARLHPAAVASAKIMTTPPALTLVCDIGVRK